MNIKRVLAASCILLCAGVAPAATSVKLNVANFIDTCDLNVGDCTIANDVCTVDADCHFGSVSPKSKVSLTGAGLLKIQLKDVANRDGTPASGEYILTLSLVTIADGTSTALFIKVPVEAGKAAVKLDVSSFIGAPGITTAVYASALLSPPEMPAECPGDNSEAGLTGRLNDFDCLSGKLIAFLGVAVGEKTAIKGNVAPIIDICESGLCSVNSDSCSSNADCSFGSASAKSKMSLSGTGRLKIAVRDVVDTAGMPASGNYMFGLVYAVPFSPVSLLVEVPVTEGKGKATADLLSFLGNAGDPCALLFGVLATPAPGPCPSGNTPEAIAAREEDEDCDDGKAIAAVGILPGS